MFNVLIYSPLCRTILAVLMFAGVPVYAETHGLEIVRFSDGILAWQLAATNGYCGVQFCESLGKEWYPVTNCWNLSVKTTQEIMAVPLSELGLESRPYGKMFFRIVWSETSLSESMSSPNVSTTSKTGTTDADINASGSLSISPAFAVDVRSYTLAETLLAQRDAETVTFSDYPRSPEGIRTLFAEHGITIHEAEGPERPHSYPPFNEGWLTPQHLGGNAQAPFSGTFLCGQSPNGLIFDFKTPVSFFGFATIGDVCFSYPSISIVAYDNSGREVTSYETSRFHKKGTFAKVSSDAEYLGVMAPSGGFRSIHIKPVPPYDDANIVYFVMDNITVQFMKTAERERRTQPDKFGTREQTE